MWLYLFQHRRKFAVKIGITRRKIAKRLAEVSKNEPCRFLFAVPVLWPALLEKWLHNRYKRLRRYDLSGREWFYFWLPIRPIFWLLFFFSAQFLFFILILYVVWQL